MPSFVTWSPYPASQQSPLAASSWTITVVARWSLYWKFDGPDGTQNEPAGATCDWSRPRQGESVPSESSLRGVDVRVKVVDPSEKGFPTDAAHPGEHALIRFLRSERF